MEAAAKPADTAGSKNDTPNDGTTTPPVATDTVSIPAWEALPDGKAGEKFKDGSKLLDKSGALELFEQWEGLTLAWVGHYVGVGEMSEALCKLSYDVRELCTRPDGVTIDWAGEYQAYKLTYGERIDIALNKLDIPKPVRAQYRSKIRQWDTDNDYGKYRMGLWLAKNDPTLGVKPEDVVIGSEFTMPDKFAHELVNIAKGQTVTNAKGVVVPAKKFEKAAEMFKSGKPLALKKSDRPKAAASGIVATTEETPSESWTSVIENVSKRTDDDKGPAAKMLDQAEEYHRLTSALALALVGPAGKNAPAGIKDKPAIVAVLKDAESVLAGVIRIMDGPKVTAEEKAEALANLWAPKQ